MKVVICLEKFSDWLEAYSIFCYFKGIEEVKVIYMESDRNNEKAVSALFEEFKNKIGFEYEIAKDKEDWTKKIKETLDTLKRGDILAAPLVRYRNIGVYVPVARKRGVVTVELSEGLPDSFCYLGYRFGFRLRGGRNIKNLLKQLVIFPFFSLYSERHKPDFCFYNMAPKVKIPYVRKTVQAYIPKVEEKKTRYLQELTKGEKRPLLISGFGYDLDKMATYLKLDKYIATSKMREIIIDGTKIPLDYYICAEEVLLSGCSDRIIGYNSTAICWAYRIGGIDITCYESPGLNEICGFYGAFTRRTMNKCGLTMFPVCKEMMKK